MPALFNQNMYSHLVRLIAPYNAVALQHIATTTATWVGRSGAATIGTINNILSSR
jgi:hypothetical protein